MSHEQDRLRSYWRDRLAGGPPPFEWPTDQSRLPAPSFMRETSTRALAPARWGAVHDKASASGLEPFTLVLAACGLLALRYSGQDAVWLGTAAAVPEGEAAPRPQLLPLCIALPHEGSVADFLTGVSAAIADAGAHRALPFASIAALAEEAGGALPLLRTLVLPDGLASPLWPSTAAPALHLLGAHAADADVILSVVADGAGGASLRAQYDSELFLPATIESLLSQLDTVLAALCGDAERRLLAVPLLDAADGARLLAQADRGARDYDRSACVHALIEQQAARTSAAAALTCAGATLSYAELNAAANRLAHRLIAKGVGPDVPVGVCIERSAEMVVAILAVLKAGGAYVPMDPAYPAQRIAYMAADSHVKLVLADRAIAGVEAEVLRPGELVDGSEPPTDPGPRCGAEALAYLIYTSGSTGQPKGVMVEHRNVVNFFAGMDDRLGTEPGVWLAVTSLSFDISVLELLWTLSRGYEVVLHSSRAQAPRKASVDFGLFYFASDAGDYALASGREKYRLLLDGARFADANGFHAVWTPERHFHIFGGLYPSPSVAAGALAMVTEHVQIRAGSVVLPLHNPVRVAEEWALVDNLSNGRVGISFASGWQPQDFAMAPANYADRHNLMFEGIETVRALWRGDERVMPGGDGKPVRVSTRPRPVQAELPTFVTAGGSPETFRRAGEVGAGVLTHLLGQSIEQLAERIAIYRRAWREAGHAGAGRVALMLHTFVSEDPAFVRSVVHEPLKTYLKGAVGLFAPVAAAKGLDVNNLSPEDLDALAEFAFERYFETSGLFGTPESCAPMVARLQALGVDELACLIDFGIPTDTVLANLPHLNALRRRCGGDAAALPPSVGELLTAHRVTHMQCTPSMATMLLGDAQQASAFAGLKRLMVGGEALSEALSAELRAAIPQGRLINMYGPTETTIWSTTHEVDDTPGAVPIGTPIANTRVYVLDAALQPVPPGVAGELYIGGDGVARGYFERPELTAERFLPDPHVPGARIYRTGDLARWRRDGTLDFLGRADQQVKLRGYRIELGEIEAALRRDPNVAEAAVVVREDVPGDKRLVACLIARAGASIDIEALRAALRASLAEFMLPAAYVTMAAFPRTPNGKLDRAALARPQAAPATAAAVSISAPAAVPAEASGAAPSDARKLQADIAAIWCEVLKLNHVGPRDNFFDLGGHSLLVVHVLNRLRALTSREIGMTDMFRFPTVESLAAFLHESPAAQAEAQPALSDAQQRAAQRRARLRRVDAAGG